MSTKTPKKAREEAAVGETLFTPHEGQPIVAFPGFKAIKPTVYAGLFPVETSEYEDLKQAVDRLSLNDPSVVIIPDSSPALGLGWKMGFLGVLHMEVFGARLDQEYGTSVILTQPSDNETIRKKRFGGKGEVSIIDASKFPEESDIEKFLEPVVTVRIIVPAEMMGIVNGLCSECRGERGDVSSIDESRLLIVWKLPLAEVVIDFFERLKRITSGYASFDYEQDGYMETKLIKLTLTINGREASGIILSSLLSSLEKDELPDLIAVVPEFSQIIPAAMARERAKLLVHRLKREIPRQQYEVTIKACVGSSSKALSQVSIQPMKRDFTQLLKGNFGGGGMERLNKKLSHQKKRQRTYENDR
ncbi:putative GTP-binding protein LepA [Cooperia oncophora]